MKSPARPRFHIKFEENKTAFSPGETLTCEYQIDLPNDGLPIPKSDDNEARRQVVSIETSVLWQTEGKGDEDIGVHFFERRDRKFAQPEILRQLHRLHTVLPASPISYDGQILKIKWMVRVRIFLDDSNSFTEDLVFSLQHPPSPIRPLKS